MDKIKQNIDLQEAIQRYNIEKSVVGTLAYNIDQNLQKGMSPDEAIENVLQKSKSMPVGTITNGYKKIAEGKWRKVSEHGLTKEEHEFKEGSHRTMKEKVQHWGKAHEEKEEKKHQQAASKLDSKDYSDEEVTGGEKKEEGSKSIKQMIIEAPIGSKASGGGYSNWTKTGNNSWKNSTTNSLSHDEGLFDRIGGFSDFKINKTKKSFQDSLSKSEQTEVQKAKVKKVMDEWKTGKLKSSSGGKVVSQSQALAIAMSEAGIEMKKSEDSDIEKGGEGSKGGKVIGHTKSGKPIYESTEVEHDHGIKVGHEVQHEGRTKKVTDVRGNILYFGNNDYAHVSKVYKKDGSSYV